MTLNQPRQLQSPIQLQHTVRGLESLGDGEPFLSGPELASHFLVSYMLALTSVLSQHKQYTGLL